MTMPVRPRDDFVDLANVGMIEGCRGSRLPMQPFTRRRILLQLVAEELDGDLPTKLCVLGKKDCAHAAVAKGVTQNVAGASCSSVQRWARTCCRSIGGQGSGRSEFHDMLLQATGHPVSRSGPPDGGAAA